jgi:phosphohistidine swiveling domain-containing protein
VIPTIPLSTRGLISAVVNQLRMQIKHKQGARALPAYLATNPEWCQRMRVRIGGESSGVALVALWRDEIRPHVKRGVWTVLGTVNQSTDYTAPLRRDLTALVGAEDANLLIANLSGETGLLPSLGPVVGLTRVARGDMEREAYLALYGHRGPHEFEISVPRPAEEPDWLDWQVAQFRRSPVDAEGLLDQQQRMFDAAWRRFSSRYPGKAKAMSRRIAESARRARLREAARSEYVRDRWLIRSLALRAGELTGLGDDIFFLTLDEVLALLSGNEQVIHHITARRESYERYKALPPYPPIIRGHFDPFQWAADPSRRSDIFDSSVSLPAIAPGDDGKNVVAGSPGATGRAEGVVRCLKSAEEGDQLREGEILVTVLTDIAWTPLFLRAAAVVTDVGAPLSHAAIVARELGIPAVVGCGDATARLHTGDRVRVDGGRGTVEILHGE